MLYCTQFLMPTLPDYDTWAEVKVLLHYIKQFPLALFGGAIVKDGNGERMGYANGIGHLRVKTSNIKDNASKKWVLLSRSTVQIVTWTRTRLQSPALTRDLATQRAA